MSATDTGNHVQGLTAFQAGVKRSFDVIAAAFGLILVWWLILLAWLVATLETRSNGFFLQARVGRHGRLFKVVKIRTMHSGAGSTVTRAGDPLITRSGKWFRRTKIDELPQLWNILCGNMSFVGPRPDVPGFADLLQGEARAVLALRPGITGPATLKYRNEEDLLARQPDPVRFNREVIWPDKVQENLNYIRQWSFRNDLGYILRTVFSGPSVGAQDPMQS